MALGKIKPIAKFRIYAWKSKYLFFHVYIWKHKKDLLKKFNENTSNVGQCEAFTRIISRYKVNADKTYKIKPICGEIHFYYKQLKTSVIVHEATHATVNVLNRLKFPFDQLSFTHEQNNYGEIMNSEEIFCYTLDNFTKQIVNKIYKLGILRESVQN